LEDDKNVVEIGDQEQVNEKSFFFEIVLKVKLWKATVNA
jgi:hypothetical protein